MPRCRPRPHYKKQYSLAVNKNIHERVHSLSKDLGCTNSEVTNILLDMAISTLGNRLKETLVNKHIRELELRRQWLINLQSDMNTVFDPPIVVVPPNILEILDLAKSDPLCYDRWS